ncbi:hypothetical protein GJA_2525 [Janthinobacterium agaricidamnosum NBRC 102515 = DSM 9628]|uniref:Uncharacterized protein n=1 Tax=Janthinobacterium agaricidamnosum NBRC 102515 = DSM 9628 TaxID=1349767 RepID=W0V5J5_9BURK|nr:hypothetical protein GJA_2525 [Janthinobacterium agaricidamnosum NBRC 102515 = DSM 9628]
MLRIDLETPVRLIQLQLAFDTVARGGIAGVVCVDQVRHEFTQRFALKLIAYASYEVASKDESSGVENYIHSGKKVVPDRPDGTGEIQSQDGTYEPTEDSHEAEKVVADVPDEVDEAIDEPAQDLCEEADDGSEVHSNERDDSIDHISSGIGCRIHHILGRIGYYINYGLSNITDCTSG